MGKFNKNGKREMPEMNTSSLPDLIFSILFFFMIVTTMREVTLKVQFKLPEGKSSVLEKLEKKSLVSFIYIGAPTQDLQAKMGTDSRIQLNDKFAEVDEVQDYIQQERMNMSESDQPFMKVSIKADSKTQMGIITDVKQALRKAYALKINYSAVGKMDD
ncbi:MAG: biopolymer transporter ExbD [Bacteroidaceae bacterium]|nr:biopolymer transporter ExbD [Candidatus Minthousia equi]MCQ2246199.1 biopolymer transporter ExbD [Bacteroidaceae bacterium]MDO4955578.1 biopolymer transporter ExbD [Bacteroidales bacterium]